MVSACPIDPTLRRPVGLWLKEVEEDGNTTKPLMAWTPEGRRAATPTSAMIRRGRSNPVAGFRRKRRRPPASIWRGEEGFEAGKVEEWERGTGRLRHVRCRARWRGEGLGEGEARGNAREGGGCLCFIYVLGALEASASLASETCN